MLFSHHFVRTLSFFIVLLGWGPIQVHARATIEIELAIENIPADGLVLKQISVGGAGEDFGNREVAGYRARFVSGGRSFDAQVVPGPRFGERNTKAMLLLHAPGQETLSGTLLLEREAAAADSDSLAVTTDSATWTFEPNGLFPSEVKFHGSETVLSAFAWNDRLHDRSRGSFFLRRDPEATVSVVSDGPVATVVRGKARFWQSASRIAPGNPAATYDWYFFKKSPEVFVDVHQTADEVHAWGESWFLQWVFSEKYFTDRLNSEGREPVSLTDSKAHVAGSKWSALTSDSEAVAMFGAPSSVFDGGGGYIRSSVFSPGSGWDGRFRRLTGWLWVTSLDGAADLPERLDRASDLAVSRFADTEIRAVHQAVPTAIPAAEPPALRDWKEALLQREFLLGRVSPDDSGILQLPENWRFSRAGDLGLALNVKPDGLELLSLYDLRGQRELAAEEMPPLFVLDLFDPAEKESVSLDAREGWESVSFNDAGERLDFRFRREEAEGAPVSVIVSAYAVSRDSAWEWKMRVENPGSVRSVREVRFPQVSVQKLGSEIRTFVPRQAGIVVAKPFHENFSYNRVYPTGSGNMQFMAVYPDEADGAGLYVARHDPVAATKRLLLNTDNLASSTTLAFSQTPENPETPGNGFEITGAGVWKLLRGDWFDAARYYREWVRNEAVWWPELTDDGRADTPLWYRELNVWSTRGGAAESARPVIQRLQEFLEMPLGNHWWYWHEIPFDNDYPHYFPAVEGFREAVADLQRNDVFVMPYINGRLWDTRDRGVEDYQFSALALPWATKIRSGDELIPSVSTFRSRESDGSAVSLAVMCPYTEFWQDKVSEIVGRLTRGKGVRGVYLDQVGTSPPVLCLDPTHGHPLGGGSWWVEGYDQMLSRIQDELPEEVILTTEDHAEPYIDNFDGVLTWQWIYDGQVPAFAAVYGGTIQMFGRYYFPVSNEDPNLAARMKMGQQLVFGEQLGWIHPEFLLNRLNDGTRQYFKRLVHTRNRINSYFYAGKMLRPPVLAGLNPPVTAGWKAGPVTLDAVLTGAWKKYGEKKLVLIFTNVTDESFEFIYRFDPAEYGVPAAGYQMAGYQMTSSTSTPAGRETTRLNFESETTISVPGLSTVIREVSW